MCTFYPFYFLLQLSIESFILCANLFTAFKIFVKTTTFISNSFASSFQVLDLRKLFKSFSRIQIILEPRFNPPLIMPPSPMFLNKPPYDDKEVADNFDNGFEGSVNNANKKVEV